MMMPSLSHFLLWLFWSMLFVSQSGMDIAAGLLSILALFQISRSEQLRNLIRKTLRSSFLFWLCVAWLAVIGVGLFVVAPWGDHLWPRFFEFRWMLELGLWILLLRGIQPKISFVPWILAVPALNACYGLFAYFFGFQFPPFPPQDDPTRLGGFFGNPMPYAHTVGPLFAALAGAGFSYWVRTRKWNGAWWCASLLIGLSTLLTMTRGVWLGVLLPLAFAPLLFRAPYGRSMSLGVLILAIMTVATLPSLRERALQSFDPKTSYDSERLILWKTNLAIFRDHPFFGAGYSENRRLLERYYADQGLPETQFKSHAHNQYIHFLAGTGLLGLLCFLTFIGLFLRRSWLVSRKAENPLIGALASGLFLGMVAFFIGSLTESNFSIAKNRMLVLFFCAVAAALPEWAGKNAER